MPRGTGTSDRVGRYASEIAHLKTLIDKNIQRCWDEIIKIEEFMAGVDDSLVRQLIRLRFINGKSWQQIAFDIDHYDESYPRRKFNEYLTKRNKQQKEAEKRPQNPSKTLKKASKTAGKHVFP